MKKTILLLLLGINLNINAQIEPIILSKNIIVTNLTLFLQPPLIPDTMIDYGGDEPVIEDEPVDEQPLDEDDYGDGYGGYYAPYNRYQPPRRNGQSFKLRCQEAGFDREELNGGGMVVLSGSLLNESFIANATW